MPLPSNSGSDRLARRILFALYGVAGALWLFYTNYFDSVEGDLQGTNAAVTDTGILLGVIWAVAVIAVIARPRRPAIVSAAWMALFLVLDFGWLIVGGISLQINRVGGPGAARDFIFVMVSVAVAVITLLPATVRFR